ncbi:ubiquitin-like protein ISG15 [Chelmon rostratus]|uniref:ubiquitin-like protein ISG15 n=1 Tax=Chelmon rostratus TaxID=109905 RepID=UPI001BE689B5|nr:ubiquitin-like protein ISG15 [Chelmon rostratus]
MDLSITMLNGASRTLRLNPQDTVRDLKLLIQTKLGFPPQTQKLVFVNGQMTPLSDDSKPVTSYGLQSGSQVSLLITQPATIQVFVKNEKGQVNTYDIKPDETVGNLKSRVQCREGVAVSQQRLVYQSKEMEDGRRLSDYNVEALSTINLLLRLRGG